MPKYLFVRLAGATVLAATAAAGCSSSHQVLSTKAQPVLVSPASPSWDIPVGIEVNDGIHISVENRGSDPITIIWEESSYIDVSRRSHPVVPSSAAAAGRLPRSVLPPGTRLDERLTPIAGIADDPLDPLLSTRQSGHWWKPFDSTAPLRIGSEIDPNNPILGKEIGVFLVLEKDGNKKTVLAKYTLAPAS